MAQQVIFALGLAGCALVTSGIVAVLAYVAGRGEWFEDMDLTTFVFAVAGVGFASTAAGAAAGLWMRSRDTKASFPWRRRSVVLGLLALLGALFAPLLQAALVYPPSVAGVDSGWIAQPWGYGLFVVGGGLALIVGTTAWPERASPRLFALLLGVHLMGAGLYALVLNVRVVDLDGYIGWPVFVALMAYGPAVMTCGPYSASGHLKGWARVAVASWFFATGLAALDVATKALLVEWVG